MSQKSFPSPPITAPMPILIEEALRNNWLEIWYQPKIDLKRKCLAGAEALVRINHPQEGLLGWETILSAIDEADQAHLMEHVLLTALSNWSIFADAGFNLHFAVNVPAVALYSLPIAELVAQNRPRDESWPGLILEVTEDQIVRDIERAKDCARAFKAYGVGITIDDFGAGYSSFSSLRDLPFAEVKLDGSFVQDCATDADNAAICQTTIDLAHRFGSIAVGESIQSMTDLQALMVMGCDFGQGALVAPPMPKERFLELLRQRNNKPREQAQPNISVQPAAAGRVA